MTYREFKQELQRVIEKIENDGEFECYGIRFENKERTVGMMIEENSKSNSDRECEREFPEYRTQEYENLEELDGVSAYRIDWNINVPTSMEDMDVDVVFGTDHCYILGAYETAYGEDEGEIVMQEPVVVEKMF